MKNVAGVGDRISRNEAKDFLRSLANLQDGPSAFGWFKNRFRFVGEVRPELLYCESEPESADASDSESYGYYLSNPDPEAIYRFWWLRLRETVRRIWLEEDAQTKISAMSKVDQDFFLQGKAILVQSPIEDSVNPVLRGLRPRTRTEQLVAKLLKVAHLTGLCKNPDCPTPYFIGTRRGQKYCSSECKNRISGQLWWDNHGSEWRRNRRGQAIPGESAKA
jgi:hypothetical protein